MSDSNEQLKTNKIIDQIKSDHLDNRLDSNERLKTNKIARSN
jgi:hypothetical protein